MALGNLSTNKPPEELARLRHPDHGGSDEAMSALNDAITRFRQERAA